MSSDGSVRGGVRWLLRAEGLCLLVLALFAWVQVGEGRWGLFAACFLIPDVSFLGYLAGARIGALAYNAAHSLIGAIACLAAGVGAGESALLMAGVIWTAHIGFDRAMGYGLKYAQGFGFTHLGRLGRA